MEDVIKITGSVHIVLTAPDGTVKQDNTDHNLITTVGKYYLMAWLAAASQPGEFMSYIALGTGTTPPALGNTTLQTEIGTRSLGTLVNISNTWNNTATFAPGNCTGAITEAGLFSAITAGTMFARQTFAAFNKASGDTMTVSWTITVS
jgi:hypothetical protein